MSSKIMLIFYTIALTVTLLLISLSDKSLNYLNLIGVEIKRKASAKWTSDPLQTLLMIRKKLLQLV